MNSLKVKCRIYYSFDSTTMFAVPGWSISADFLKTQTGSNAPKTATVNRPGHPIGTDQKKSRKRKRGHGSSDALEVTDENLGDLWKRHIEEKSLDQPQPKKNENKVNQSNEGKDDALGKIENVDGGGFEGFSEQDQTARSIEEETLSKKKERKRKEHKPTGSAQNNGHEDAAETTPQPLKEQGQVENGKSKYEQRKAKAVKKREHRALLQANGTLPPNRPENVSTSPTKKTPANLTQTAKPSKSSKAPDAPQEPTVTESGKLSRAPEPPEPSRAPDPTQTPATPLLPSTKLTPLQQRMAAKLTSARFRHLNQTLYTSPSNQAMRLFADSPHNYTSYHAGFRAQVAVWPQNPVLGFIEDIKARATVSVPSQKKLWREQKKKKGKKPKGGNGDATTATTTSTTPGGEKSDPLPRSQNGMCTVADLGCGDATLAGSLSPSAKSLNFKLLSFDLAKGDTPHAHLVTVADISNLSAAGVKDDTVDIAICCLSLMGTNWVDIVDECARIVRAGGEVWVAEIKSRFARPGVTKDKKKKAGGGGGGIGRKKGAGKGDEDEEVDDDYGGAVAVEEMDDDARKNKGGKGETDVGAFVEVFAKRGLVLKGKPDVANKMFVRMRFVKGLGARGEKSGGGGAGGERGRGGRMYAKTRFVDDDDDEEEGVDEGKVLKPCVYKTR